MATTKCRNCGGPHRSNSRRCFACPTRSGTATKEQLKIYLQAREREYQAVLRAKAGEESTAAAETNKVNLTSSHESDNIDNILASPIDLPTGDATRL
ncbi:putative eka-like protein [Erysiphe necator]|uniref:Putative eka-like protein n=1 Tax=Uncinula necator TaxID=52586 RepID=A0A0B1NX54_UNCNE|nr:putative eka-like protein [Erysiphe necator]